MKLVAAVDLRYASRDMKAGDTFDASDSDAFILMNVGKADLAKVGPPEQPITNGFFAGEKTTGKRGRYNRRDMRAKE